MYVSYTCIIKDSNYSAKNCKTSEFHSPREFGRAIFECRADHSFVISQFSHCSSVAVLVI